MAYYTKHVTKYHGYTVAQLEKLCTRQLIGLLNSSRSVRYCCEICNELSPYQDDVEFNNAQNALYFNVKDVLAKREHIPRDKRVVARRAEKKVMKY